MFRCGADCPLQVKLLRRTFPHPSPQPAKGDLDVTRAEFHRVVEIGKFPLVPDLDGAPMPRPFLPDTDALGIVAIGAEGRSAGSSDPLRSTLVAAFLLLQPLAQRLHQLLEAAERLDEPLLLLRQVLFREPAQPLLGKFARLHSGLSRYRLQPAEMRREDPIEPIDVSLVLYQAGAREKVEGVDIEIRQALLHPLDEAQVFAQRNGQLFRLQLQEKRKQHSTRSRSAPGRNGWSGRSR